MTLLNETEPGFFNAIIILSSYGNGIFEPETTGVGCQRENNEQNSYHDPIPQLKTLPTIHFAHGINLSLYGLTTHVNIFTM